MNYKGYKELECYKQARELRIFVSGLSKMFPSHEKFLLTAQILATAFDDNYILAEELEAGETKCETVFKLINGYISYLDRSRSQIKKAL